MKPVFVAKFSRLRLLGLSLLGIGFVVLSLVLLGLIGQEYTVSEPTIVGQAIGHLALVLFGGLTLRYISQALIGGDAIRIDADGILDRAISKEVIPWEYVASIEIWSGGRSILFGLARINFPRSILYDVSKDFDLHQSLWQKWLRGWNVMLVRHSHTLQHRATDRKLCELVDAIIEFAPARLEAKRLLG